MASIDFPLYKLPNNTIIKVVSAMDIVSKVALSLVSKKSKELIRSLNLENEHFLLSISGLVTVSRKLHYSEFPHFTLHREKVWNFHEPPVQLDQVPISINIQVDYSKRFKWWNTRNLNFTQFFEHFLWVFHVKEVYQVHFWKGIREIPEIEKLKKLIPNLKKLKVEIHSSVCAKKILEVFLPASRILSTNFDLFHARHQTPISFQNYGFQNLNKMSSEYLENLELNDLLASNASEIQIYVCELVPLQVVMNRFIKNWIRGSNPRMRFISISCHRNPNFVVDSVLKGIPHTIVPEEQECTTDTDSPRRLKGGFEIRSRKGRRANVQINCSLIFSGIRIYVFD